MGTGPGGKGLDVTEVVQYLVGPAERQGKDIPSLNSRISSTKIEEAASSWRQVPLVMTEPWWKSRQVAVQWSQAMEASRKLSAVACITKKVIWTTQPLKGMDLSEARKSSSSVGVTTEE